MNIDITKLNWETHPSGAGGERAVVKFDNGYEASCIRGGIFYTRGGTYEIAIMHDDVGVCYDTGLTEDVFGYLPEDEANKTLVAISKLETRQ